jgi:hypothetical protein
MRNAPKYVIWPRPRLSRSLLHNAHWTIRGSSYYIECTPSRSSSPYKWLWFHHTIVFNEGSQFLIRWRKLFSIEGSQYIQWYSGWSRVRPRGVPLEQESEAQPLYIVYLLQYDQRRPANFEEAHSFEQMCNGRMTSDGYPGAIFYWTESLCCRSYR